MNKPNNLLNQNTTEDNKKLENTKASIEDKLEKYIDYFQNKL